MFTKNYMLLWFQSFISGIAFVYFWSFLVVTFGGNYFLHQTRVTQIVGYLVFLMIAVGIDSYRQKLSKND